MESPTAINHPDRFNNKHAAVSPKSSNSSGHSVKFNLSKRPDNLHKTLSQNSGLTQLSKAKGIIKNIGRHGSAKDRHRQRTESIASEFSGGKNSPLSPGSLASTPSNASPVVSEGNSFTFSSKSHKSSKRSEYSPKLLEKYTKEELDEFKDVFRLFDTENSGAIGTAELEAAMRSLGMNPSHSDLEHLISEVDSDGNGEIDFDEFCTVLKHLSLKRVNSEKEDIVRSCFEVFDQDLDGVISEREFRYVFREIGGFEEAQIEELFKEIDVLGNGKIGYEEFANMVKTYWLDEDFNPLPGVAQLQI